MQKLSAYRIRLAMAAMAVVTMSGLVTLSSNAGAASSGSPITLALITSLTGEGGSEFSSAPAGFNARIALQNAEGGVNGHKLKGLVLDDQTSPSAISTAVQDAVAKGAFGIVSASPLFFLAAKYPQQQGVPVTGGFFDGPEWGQQPYTNMFAADVGSVNPTYPVNTAIGGFMKAHGGTVVCSYGYSISPSSSRSAVGTYDSFMHAGGKGGILDTSIPFGSVAMTTVALAAKQKGCNAFYAGLDDNSNFALATALKQAGVTAKVVVFPTGYEPSLIDSAAWRDVQGGYFDTTFRPFQLPNAATRQMQSALEKYEHFSAKDFPTFSQYESWLGADLMIKGLELAGKNPTRPGVITALRHLKGYNGNGLLPVSINYRTIFGHDAAKACGWYMKADKKGFVASSTTPVCGTDLPGTTTVQS
ncbi:MAG TPA: ABC transporter substrate-binding protein [Acidimicrobiales bacterium]|jgi:branched-chain amino acid transport system substrate-binding protein|nr:ABC transporter substrate-binding protein [Acidimicrobiales bacterium]